MKLNLYKKKCLYLKRGYTRLILFIHEIQNPILQHNSWILPNQLIYILYLVIAMFLTRKKNKPEGLIKNKMPKRAMIVNLSPAFLEDQILVS